MKVIKSEELKLIELDKLKLLLKIEGNDKDDELNMMIDMLSEKLNDELNNTLKKETVVERVNSFNGLINTTYKINKVNSVKTLGGINMDVNYFDGYNIYLKSQCINREQMCYVEYEKGLDIIPSDIQNLFVGYYKQETNRNREKTEDEKIKSQSLNGMSLSFFSDKELNESSNKQYAAEFSAIKNKYRVNRTFF